MKRRRVRFTATALLHGEREKAWWVENRIHGDVFAEGLEDAIRLVAFFPAAGTPYTGPAVPGVRRLYLQKVGVHLYDTFDDDEVIVRALWGARRRRAPRLRR